MSWKKHQTIHYIVDTFKGEMDDTFPILSKLKITHEEKLSLLILQFLWGLVRIFFISDLQLG